MDHSICMNSEGATHQLGTPNNSHGSSPLINTQSPTTPNTAADPPSCSDKFYHFIFGKSTNKYYNIIGVTCFILLYPFLLAQSILSLSVTGRIDFINEVSLKTKNPGSTNDLHQKVFESKPMNIKLKHLNTVAAVRLGLLSLLWLVVNLCVPSLRRKTLFGCSLWKWSLLVVVLLLGHFTAIFTICVPFEVLTNTGVLKGKNRLEYFIRGLQYNGSMLFYFVMVLCAWEFYFQTIHGLNPNPGGIDMFCTRALWVCLVGTALWVLKSAVMLHWKAKAILERFKDRIKPARIPLFLLICIIIRLEDDKDKHKEPFPLPWWLDDDKDKSKKENVTLLQIEEVARSLTRFAAETSRDDNATEEILKEFQRRVQSNNEGGPYRSCICYRCRGGPNISEEWLVDMFKLDKDVAPLLIEEVRAKNPSDEIITCETFRKWMVVVKSIGILTTTCLKIGTEEKMLYPNSNLSTQLIINLEAKPDPTDLIELVLDSSTTSDQIDELQKRITSFFKGDENKGSFNKTHEVMVKEMGNTIKMSIEFEHILNVDDVTHTKCFEKKNRQRNTLFIKTKKLLEELSIKVGTQIEIYGPINSSLQKCLNPVSPSL